MTMGIVRVACLAAWLAGVARGHENVDLEPDQLGGKTLDLVWVLLSKSRLEGDVHSFQVAQLA